MCGARPARAVVSMEAGGGSEGATATLETVKNLSDQVLKLLFAVMVRTAVDCIPVYSRAPLLPVAHVYFAWRGM